MSKPADDALPRKPIGSIVSSAHLADGALPLCRSWNSAST